MNVSLTLTAAIIKPPAPTLWAATLVHATLDFKGTAPSVKVLTHWPLMYIGG
jgi:hypothetical protein